MHNSQFLSDFALHFIKICVAAVCTSSLADRRHCSCCLSFCACNFFFIEVVILRFCSFISCTRNTQASAGIFYMRAHICSAPSAAASSLSHCLLSPILLSQRFHIRPILLLHYNDYCVYIYIASRTLLFLLPVGGWMLLPFKTHSIRSKWPKHQHNDNNNKNSHSRCARSRGIQWDSER